LNSRATADVEIGARQYDFKYYKIYYNYNIFRGFIIPHSKISITIPDEILVEIKKIAAQKQIKISRLIAETLAEKVKKAEEEDFISRINKIFEDPTVSEEQRHMAEDIAGSMDIKELPW